MMFCGSCGFSSGVFGKPSIFLSRRGVSEKQAFNTRKTRKAGSVTGVTARQVAPI